MGAARRAPFVRESRGCCSRGLISRRWESRDARRLKRDTAGRMQPREMRYLNKCVGSDLTPYFYPGAVRVPCGASTHGAAVTDRGQDEAVRH